MNKLKIAKTISTITNPPIVCIPLFMIICLVLSFENGLFNFNKFIVLELISLVFASILPMAIIVYWAKKLNTDGDISNRQDRFVPLVVGIISYFIGFIVSLVLGVDNFLTALLLCYSINTGVVLLITFKWKISIHTTGLSGPVGALILLLGPIGAVFGIIYPMLIWSRVILNKHTLSQAITGFFLTIFEMYLFMGLLGYNVVNLTPLIDCVWLVLAIIYLPVVFGLISYSNISNKKVVLSIFKIAGIVLFLVFGSLEVFIIYVLIVLTCIFIKMYNGDEKLLN